MSQELPMSLTGYRLEEWKKVIFKSTIAQGVAYCSSHQRTERLLNQLKAEGFSAETEWVNVITRDGAIAFVVNTQGIHDHVFK